jgi:hypothetical protein
MTDFDPFTFDAGIEEYSREKFYTKAYDHRGHTSTFRWGKGSDERVNIPPYIMSAVTALREQLPQYRTNGDFIRDAIIHTMRMRHEQLQETMSAEWNDRINLIVTRAENERLRKWWQDNAAAIEEIEGTLREAKTDSQRLAAVHSCETIASFLDADYMVQAAAIIDRYR